MLYQGSFRDTRPSGRPPGNSQRVTIRGKVLSTHTFVGSPIEQPIFGEARDPVSETSVKSAQLRKLALSET